MTKYVIEYEKDGQWCRTPRLFDSMTLAELQAVYRKEPTRVVAVSCAE